VCVCVCLSVCQHDNSCTVRDIITKFSGHHPTVEREDKFDNGYIGVHGRLWYSSLIVEYLTTHFMQSVNLKMI